MLFFKLEWRRITSTIMCLNICFRWKVKHTHKQPNIFKTNSQWASSGFSHLHEGCSLLHCILINLLMSKSTEWGSNSMSLSHFKVLSEVLISAPPIELDHTDSLISELLVEVTVSHIALLSICWHSSISMWLALLCINFTNDESPFLCHFLLFYLRLLRIMNWYLLFLSAI